jgi:hypothetical protein
VESLSEEVFPGIGRVELKQDAAHAGTLMFINW